MRTSIAISVIILAMAAVLGWHFDQLDAMARTVRGKLVAEAARLSISIDTSNPANPCRITKRPRDISDDPVQLAADYLAVARELGEPRKSGVPINEALIKRSTDLRRRMGLLEFSQTKILIAEFHASEKSGNATCQYAIYSLLNDLAIDEPQTVLSLLTDSADLIRLEYRDHLIASAIAVWAKEDPQAAFEWIQNSGRQFPEETNRKLKVGVIYCASVTDPKLAFQLLGRSGIEDTGGYAGGILKCAGTAESRSAALASYREYFANLKDEKPRMVAGTYAVGELTDGLAKNGFAAATHWLAGANLTSDELNRFANRLPSTTKPSDRGQWIDWIGKTLPPDKATDCIRRNVREWALVDYQSAGKWLASAPDSPAKHTAARAYSEALFPHDRETAIQWALTLPPGEDRDSTLRQIYQKWPEDDPIGAAAFAKEHGIK